MHPPIKAHVFTDVSDQLFLKQSPGFSSEVNGVIFSFGTEVPEDAEVLIVFNRASYAIRTTLPRARTAFLAAEPDVIHPYSRRFLNQFGLVQSTTAKDLQTEKWRRASCWYWFAGYNFNPAPGQAQFRGHDWFSSLAVPEKADKISIVTTNKTNTEYHRKRLAFIDVLKDLIPEHLDIYGRGFKSVDDKADAILPNRYHLAVENGAGPHAWTEKLADPFLCWAFPFYAGCDNVEKYFPAESFSYVDLDDPHKEAQRLVTEIQNGRWQASLGAIGEARKRILEQHNLMIQLSELTLAVAARPAEQPAPKMRRIWSERSILPEAGTRGSLPEWVLRNALLLADPDIELKTAGLRSWRDRRRSDRRNRKNEKREQGQRR